MKVRGTKCLPFMHLLGCWSTETFPSSPLLGWMWHLFRKSFVPYLIGSWLVQGKDDCHMKCETSHSTFRQWLSKQINSVSSILYTSLLYATVNAGSVFNLFWILDCPSEGLHSHRKTTEERGFEIADMWHIWLHLSRLNNNNPKPLPF